MSKFPCIDCNSAPIHFVGIGGCGMSAIAEILHKSGVLVSGCDQASSSTTKRLHEMGIPISISHDADHITTHTSRIVFSTAITKDNEEIIKATELRVPIIHRSDMMREIISSYKSPVAVSGTHGKSTITAMIATLLSTATLSPTVINGGIMNGFGSNAVLGENKNLIVVEADESDGSFLKIPPARMVIVSNIDLDHMEYFKTEENLENKFGSFVHNVQENGLVVLCSDCPRVRKLIEYLYLPRGRILTYGLKSADRSETIMNIRGTNIRFMESGMQFDVEFVSQEKPSVVWKDLILSSVFGEHNVQNALSVIAIAQELGLEEEIVRNSLNGYSGVERRFSCTGVWNTTRIFSDYAHHPTEISAVIKTARSIFPSPRKLIVIHQPHRSIRLDNLFQEYTLCFKGADHLVLLPTYETTERCNNTRKTLDLANAVRKSLPQLRVFYFKTSEEVMQHVANSCTEKFEGVVICTGAGPAIDKLAKELPEFLINRSNQ